MADFNNEETVVVDDVVVAEEGTKKDYSTLMYGAAGAVAGVGMVFLIQKGIELAFPEFCLNKTNKKIAKLEAKVAKRHAAQDNKLEALKAKKAELEKEVSEG